MYTYIQNRKKRIWQKGENQGLVLRGRPTLTGLHSLDACKVRSACCPASECHPGSLRACAICVGSGEIDHRAQPNSAEQRRDQSIKSEGNVSWATRQSARVPRLVWSAPARLRACPAKFNQGRTHSHFLQFFFNGNYLFSHFNNYYRNSI